jgi:hypothetical protein
MMRREEADISERREDGTWDPWQDHIGELRKVPDKHAFLDRFHACKFARGVGAWSAAAVHARRQVL